MNEPRNIKQCNAPHLCVIACPYNKTLGTQSPGECIISLEVNEEMEKLEIVFANDDQLTSQE